MRSRSSIAAAALVAAASAFCAAALAGPKRLPSAADNIVARATPKRLYLKTAMDEEEIKFYLYLPPADGRETGPGPAAAPGGGTGPSGAGVPSAAAGPGSAPPPHAIIIFSGDWGWTPILEDTATVLARSGRPVLGVDSTQYFLKMLDGAGLAADLAMLRTTLNQQAGRPQGAPVIVIGFAYGAEMVPYLLNRAGAKGVEGALLIAPGKTGASVFRAAVVLNLPTPEQEAFDVAAEYRRFPPLPAVVLEGGDDDRSQGRVLSDMLRGPHTYVSIPAADHQFHDLREPFYKQVQAAIDWVESQKPSPQGFRPAGAAPPDRPTVGPGVGGHPLPPGTALRPPAAPPPESAPTPRSPAPPSATPQPERTPPPQTGG